MDPKSVRDVVPYFDANLLGIDIFELEKERFSSREHKKLMVQHQRRVQHFEHVKQVVVTGRITGTNVFQKRDGSTGFSIKVRAEEISPVSEKTNEAAIMNTWPTAQIGQAQPIEESAPF